MAIDAIQSTIYDDSFYLNYIQNSVWEPLLLNKSADLNPGAKNVLIPKATNTITMNDYTANTELAAATLPDGKNIDLEIDFEKYTNFEVDISKQAYVRPSLMQEYARRDAEAHVLQFESDCRTAFDVNKTDVGNVPANRKLGPDASGHIAVAVADVGGADHIKKVWDIFRSATLLARQLNWPADSWVCVGPYTVIDWLIEHQEALKLPSINDSRIAEGLNAGALQTPLRGWAYFVDNGIDQTVTAEAVNKHSLYFMRRGVGFAFARRWSVNRVVDLERKFAQEKQVAQSYGFTRLENDHLFRVHTRIS